MLLGSSTLKRNSGETPTSELAFPAVIGQLVGAQQIGARWGSAKWLLTRGSEATLGIPFPPHSNSSDFLELRREKQQQQNKKQNNKNPNS